MKPWKGTGKRPDVDRVMFENARAKENLGIRLNPDKLLVCWEVELEARRATVHQVLLVVTMSRHLSR